MSDIAGVISALGVMVTSFLSYNQYAKNKKTDFKIEQWKKAEEEKSRQHNSSFATIFGVLWGVLHESGASRVYVIQPHPLINSMFISVGLEVRKNGVSSIKDGIKDMSIEDMSLFVSDLANRDYMVYKDVGDELKDNRARAIFVQNGSESMVVKRLMNNHQDWVGTLVLDYTYNVEINPVHVRELAAEAANSIQFILPEYK